MPDKRKASCIFKTHILSFMTLTLFERILEDTRKKERGNVIKNKCVFLPYIYIFLSYITGYTSVNIHWNWIFQKRQNM